MFKISTINIIAEHKGSNGIVKVKTHREKLHPTQVTKVSAACIVRLTHLHVVDVDPLRVQRNASLAVALHHLLHLRDACVPVITTPVQKQDMKNMRKISNITIVILL
jgi:hypothetical protein